MGKQVSRKTRIILIVCAAAFVAAAAAVLLGVLLTQLPKDSGNNPQVEYLPQSAKGELLVAEKVGSSRPNGDVLLIARSYDGNVWEAMPDQDNDPPQIDCNDQNQCTMKIDGEFKTYSVDVPQQLKELSPLHLASRLHLQATFGATKDELLRVSSTYGTDYSLWVLDQMRLTPTYSRTYYRQRANARPGHFQMGRTTKPCDIGSRWHNYVFEATDKYRSLQITLNAAASRFVIKVNNVVRGEVGNLFNKAYNVTTGYTFPLNLRICTVIEEVGGTVTLTLANQTVCNLSWKNPAIDFIPNSAIQTYGPNDALLDPVIGARPGSVILKNRVVSCTGASDGAGNYYIRQGNATYIFDARIKLMRNTMETPSNVEAAYTGQCPVVSKTYENRGQCVRRSACSGSTTFKSATFTLNDDILRGWYTNSTRYVYYVTDLRLTDPYNVSPCTSGTSRWMRLGKGACPSPTTTLDATTKNTLVTALTNTNDANPYVRDISLTGANCSPVTATIGAQLDAAGECFQHVHPDLYSVRDFTRWVDIHDGNQEAMKNGNPNPISKWAEIYKQTNLPFPSTHPMSRFADRRGYIPLVGRYGDTINFQDLSTDLQTEEIATLVGALRPTAAGDSFVACGSYGEVENLADLGYHYNVWNFNATAYQTEYMEWPIPAKTDHYTVLENVALKATDQLRQRVAWSLLNIVTIASQDIDFQEYIEGWLSYYDMLVRNSFGSYIDIMRDVSYHPLMGQYLSYYQNKAFAVQSNYPDENYAREIMQLFSIGLWRLNDDGTQMLDQDGVPMETYTNDDIIDFARLWTGFDRQAIRDNFATIFAFGTSSNYVDKMQIRPQWRDRFPKAKLDAGYLGDTYPLCDDMPAQSFLREGARYEFTGSFSVEGDLIDQENVTNVGPRGRLQPSTDSALYKALCAPASSGGACTFPLAVTLTSNLPCTGVKECNAQRVLAVKIVDPVAKVTRYYQYIGLPCVRLTVFDQGRLVKRDGNRGQCADPATRVASPICCNAAGATASNYTSECMFANEVTDYATAQSRCESMGLRTCSPAVVRGTTWANACALYAYAWTNATCTVQVQVYSTGQVGIYDPTGSAYFNILKPSSNNLFRVRWDNNNAYPQADNVTCPAGCGFQATPDGAGSCLCNFTVSTGPVYGQLSDLNGINGDDAVNTIAQKAFIGSVKPSLYDTDTYTTCGSSECTRLSNVVVWIHKDDNGGLSEKTIFQLPPVRLGGRDRYLFNKASTVVVSDSFSFRNPPHFTPLLGELTDVGADYLSDNLWVRKAEYEVESLLEHLFEHDNTAVFVSYRLIQQMVTSNPSPRYVKSVVNAFRTGAVGDIRFSGKYGDLGATVYAILMDHEARSPIVEADKTYGMLRDPLLKVYHFMRSLGYTSTKGREVAFTKMDQTIGVQPFTAPTVFGFYLPEYRPQGRVGDAGLVGPQVQIATTPALVGYLNGITSLIDNGLTSCDGGFAIPQTFGTRTCNALGPNPTSDGVVSYTPPDGVSVEEMVDELDMILLGGRLNPTTRATFIQEYNNVYRNASYAPQALRHLLKLFAISAEYQTTNLNALTATPRTESNAVKPQGRKFKAIVVVFEYGGCDSYSLIVPLANCPKKDMYNEYRTVRTDAALDAKALQPTAINVPAGTQPCNTFAVHPSMTNLYNLYQEGSALFTTNIGALVEPVTKDQVNRRTGRLPPSLFAHNIMQRNVQNVYAQYLAANGVLGRLTDALLENNPAYASALFSLSGNVKMVQGKLAADYLSGSTGVVRVRNLASIANALGNITEFVSDSVYADTYADTMRTSVGKTEVLGSLLANTNLTVTFGKSGLDLQMSQVAKLIKSMPDATGIERAVFFTSIGGFDTHATFDLSPLLGPVDTALGNFAAEMKAQGKWDDVVVLSVSDFARTLTSNGKGTDHAWGGNHFVAGGSIKGGQILGHYPEVLSDDGPQVLTRGRVIPTMPFEGMWKGIAEWFGVPADQMEKVLPNLKNFPDDVMYSKEQMFKKF